MDLRLDGENHDKIGSITTISNCAFTKILFD